MMGRTFLVLLEKEIVPVTPVFVVVLGYKYAF
jgi:hypothetical protein